MTIEANGIELHVEQRGAGGPALVFLHYWGGSSRTWQHVVDALRPTTAPSPSTSAAGASPLHRTQAMR
jgi:hypothetical protein